MRLLDRYLTRELFIPLGYCLVGFLIFWISFDWLAMAEDFRDSGMPLSACLRYYGIKLPEFLGTILPIALLLALLYTLTDLSRHHEYVAIRAAGVSWWRLCAPYLFWGFAFSILLLCLNETWGAKSAEASHALLHGFGQEGTNQSNPGWQEQVFFHNHRDGRKWFIKRYNPQTGEMISPWVVLERSELNEHRIEAASAKWEEGVWTFLDANEIYTTKAGEVLMPQTRHHDRLTQPSFTETPQAFKTELKINNMSSVRMAKEAQISLREILAYQSFHAAIPAEMNARLNTQFHGRIAWPFTCLVVVLIAIPFGASSGRKNVFAGVASSIFLCFGYFILLRLGLALGTRGTLPPFMAAWLPNLVFGGSSILFIRKTR
jgi:lipopolysaccharide export system permease protein